MRGSITPLRENEEVDLVETSFSPVVKDHSPPQTETRRKYGFPKFFADLKKSEKDEKVEDEAQKDLAKEEAKQKEMFINAVDDSSKPLLKIKSVFPFDFFPNELIVDMVKVTMVKKDFIFSP
jgi:hypothetical protein